MITYKDGKKRKKPPTPEEIARALCNYLEGWEWEDELEDSGGFGVYVGGLGRVIVNTWAEDTLGGEVEDGERYYLKIELAAIDGDVHAVNREQEPLWKQIDRIENKIDRLLGRDCPCEEELVASKVNVAERDKLRAALQEIVGWLRSPLRAIAYRIIRRHGIDPEAL
jgi:hypothetical protein